MTASPRGGCAPLSPHLRVPFAAPQEFSLLYEEACFFQLTPLQSQLERWRAQRGRGGSRPECLVLHVAPELGEKISVSAHRAVVLEVFPEVADSRLSPESTHVSRFPLSACCRLNSVQVGTLVGGGRSAALAVLTSVLLV